MIHILLQFFLILSLGNATITIIIAIIANFILIINFTINSVIQFSTTSNNLFSLSPPLFYSIILTFHGIHFETMNLIDLH